MALLIFSLDTTFYGRGTVLVNFSLKSSVITLHTCQSDSERYIVILRTKDKTSKQSSRKSQSLKVEVNSYRKLPTPNCLKEGKVPF